MIPDEKADETALSFKPVPIYGNSTDFFTDGKIIFAKNKYVAAFICISL